MASEQDNAYLLRIRELEKQITRLQTEIKKNSETQYGLRWMDVPEAFEAASENALPILEEVKEKALTNDDGKPTHILIEGDNFHALTCLNYTHKGQIDVIYIDPPYNTGSDGFVYKDKRVLDKYPDGTTVPTDHPLRHSYWLSFMHKRLELAKNLLSDRGVIFISIDDNEQANLKLLCDQVFGEKNYVGMITRATGTTTGQDANKIGSSVDYCFVYKKSESFILNGLPLSSDDAKRFNLEDEKGRYSILQLRKTGNADRKGDRPNMFYPIIAPDGSEVYPFGPSDYLSRWRVAKKTYMELLQNDMIFWKEDNNSKDVEIDGYKKSKWTPYVKYYLEGRTKQVSNLFQDIEGNKKASLQIKDIFGDKGIFEYPKPVEFIKILIGIGGYKSSIILDFFGGSGTTMHATMQLNEEDGGHRQCILVQQNENNICESVTYERNRRVMQGYTNAKGEQVAGLGNSMKYYRTAFVGDNDITHITDSDKVVLTQRAGCLLALGENTLEEIKTAKAYQIFQLRKGDKPANDFEFTAVYFSGNLMHFVDFRRDIEQLQQEHPLARIAVYVFTWGDPSVFENEFDDLSGLTIKPIPQPILEIYQNIHQL
ncbi:MAG: site-specific DNA-methyltransferase [Paludibacteraceae bacterium]|nr:site-specific DNA-methyltransferase [Paludibacteraceae bacterium]